jgi:hypothetical protein
MEPKSRFSPISGDVDMVQDVRVNAKGGSWSAILKKPIRQRLGDISDHVCAAGVEFGDGSGIVLLRADGQPPVVVRSLGARRFEISIEAADDEEIDELTAAFLRLKIDQFKSGLAQLSPPYTAESLGSLVAEIEPFEHEVAAKLERTRASKNRTRPAARKQ